MLASIGEMNRLDLSPPSFLAKRRHFKKCLLTCDLEITSPVDNSPSAEGEGRQLHWQREETHRSFAKPAAHNDTLSMDK